MKTAGLSACAGLGIAVVASAGTNIGTFGGGSIPDATTTNVTPGVLTLTGVVAGAGTISNLGVDIQLTHTWAGDVEIDIVSPAGTVVTLVDQVGDVSAGSVGDSSEYDSFYLFRDGGANLWTAAANTGFGLVIPGGHYAPSDTFDAPSFLSALNGESADGTWTLIVRDWAVADLGSIGSWTLLNVPAPGSAVAFLIAAAGTCRRRR